MRVARWAAALALASLAAGCAAPAGDDRDARVHEAGADRKVSLPLDSGPMGDLVIARDTGGGLVVSGLCYFPDGARITITLYDTTGAVLGRTQPTVERAFIRSLPLRQDSGAPWPAGRYDFELSAVFAAGAQTPEVLRESKSGNAFHGPGMTRTRQGGVAYDRRFRVGL